MEVVQSQPDIERLLWKALASEGVQIPSDACVVVRQT